VNHLQLQRRRGLCQFHTTTSPCSHPDHRGLSHDAVHLLLSTSSTSLAPAFSSSFLSHEAHHNPQKPRRRQHRFPTQTPPLLAVDLAGRRPKKSSATGLSAPPSLSPLCSQNENEKKETNRRAEKKKRRTRHGPEEKTQRGKEKKNEEEAREEEEIEENEGRKEEKTEKPLG
jgi:hypothetical protein